LNGGKTKTGLGLNRKGRGLPKQRMVTISLFLSHARTARRCEITKFSLSLSLMLKRQCSASACGERGVNHKAMDCKMILPRSLCSLFCFLPFQTIKNTVLLLLLIIINYPLFDMSLPLSRGKDFRLIL